MYSKNYRYKHKNSADVIPFTMSNCTNFVGVIDSGVGGLTVLQQLQRDFPCCNYVYIADSAYCPYGTKQPQQIQRRVETLVKYLQDNGAQAVVIACNTASVFARTLRSKFRVPIYDVIAPTCDAVTNVTKTKRVALLATDATVNSNAYQDELQKRGITVTAFPCSSFVPFVEANATDTVECADTVSCALEGLPKCNADTVILGCTHFPLLRKQIAPHVSGATVVECCTNFQPTVLPSCKSAGKNHFFTTGVEKQANFASQWFGKINFSHLDL